MLYSRGRLTFALVHDCFWTAVKPTDGTGSMCIYLMQAASSGICESSDVGKGNFMEDGWSLDCWVYRGLLSFLLRNVCCQKGKEATTIRQQNI